MTLRTKLLGVFAALALAPLVAVGLFDYVRSVHAVRRLIRDQTSVIADRAAQQARDRLTSIESDARLLADNEETVKLFRAHAMRDPAARDSARAGAHRYLANAWDVVGHNFAWVSFQDTAGVEIERLGEQPRDLHVDLFNNARAVEIATIPVRTGESSTIAGRMVAATRIDSLVPRGFLEARFGRGGYTVVSDSTGRRLFDPLSTTPNGEAALAALRLDAANGDTGIVSATVTFTEHDSARIATIALIRPSPVAIISAGAVEELTSSFAQVRLTNLALAIALSVALAGCFVVLTRRMTRPLETLTAAAEEVGRGNFAPILPLAGNDEVGRLADAFGSMSAHIDRMMGELEASRQMAAVGSFARQISHEIRNPLTSIKLNLQHLERDARAGIIPADSRRTIEICLGEIQRLDRVVRGVLKLARTAARERQTISVATVVERAIDVILPQLVQQRITVAYEAPERSLMVDANEEQLVGVFLNLFVNAAEAMPAGGELRVAIEKQFVDGGPPSARVTVRDSGRGIPHDARAKIFDPFFTTKSEGSGLGLAVALRDAEAHHGRITLLGSAEQPIGATFAVDLPLAATEPT